MLVQIVLNFGRGSARVHFVDESFMERLRMLV